MKPQITLDKLPGIWHDHDQADWLVGPVGRTRDSDLVESSNWEVATALLAEVDPDGVDHEIHRFGHYAVGWIEEIACRPGSAVASEALKIRASLDDHPILDEDHLGQLECEAVDASWPDIASELRGKIRAIEPDLDESLDELDDAAISELARDLGEESDGWIRYSARDVRVIADKIIAG